MPISFGGGGSQPSNSTSKPRQDPAAYAASGRKSPDPFKRFRRNSVGNLLSSSTSASRSGPQAQPNSSTTQLPPPPPPKPSSLTKPAFGRSRKAKPASLSLLGSPDILHRSSTRPNNPSPAFEELKEVLEPCAASPASAPRSGSRLRYLGPASPRRGTQAWYQAQQKTINLQQSSPAVQAQRPPLDLPASSSGAGVRSPLVHEQQMIDAGVQIIKRRDIDTESLASLPLSSHRPTPLPSPSVQLQGTGSLELDYVETIGGAGPTKASANGHGSSVEGSANEYLSASSSTYSLNTAAATGPRRRSMEQYMGQQHQQQQMSSGSSSSSHHHQHAPRPATSMALRQHHDNPSEASLPSFYSSTDAASPRDATVRRGGYLSPSPGTSAHPFLNKHAAMMGKTSAASSGGTTARHGLVNLFAAPSSSAAVVAPAGRDDFDRTLSVPPRPARPKPSVLHAFQQGSSAAAAAPLSHQLPHSAVPILQRPPLHDKEAEQQPLASIPRTTNLSYEDVTRVDSAVGGAFGPLRASSSTPLPPPRRLNAGSTDRPRPLATNGSGNDDAWSSTGRGHASHGGGMATALGQVGQLGAAVGRRGWEFMRTLNHGGGSATGGAGSASGSTSRSAIPVRVDKGGGRSAAKPSSLDSQVDNAATRQWLAALQQEGSGGAIGLPGVSPRRHQAALAARVSGVRANGGDGAPQGHLFGVPLRDAVLRSRLLEPEHGQTHVRSPSGTRLSIPDLGTDFSVNMNFLDDSSASSNQRTSRNRQSVAGKVPASREEARAFYLPGIVVRCIESLERWGPQEEGIYRLSGRSSHTAKLRSVFDDQMADICLEQIGPADLDINSVCSVLKSYLRELPDSLIPASCAKAFDHGAMALLGSSNGSTNAGAAAPREVATTSGSGVDGVNSELVSKHLVPVIGAIPCVNWYLLRELCDHLGWLSDPKVAVQTKMPLNNLCLVLAPTLSLSVVMLRLIVEFRADIFIAPGPAPDPELDAVFHKQKPPLPDRPAHLQRIAVSDTADVSLRADTVDVAMVAARSKAQLETPSKLPRRVRKRSSTASIASLLSGGVLRSDRRGSATDASPTTASSKPSWVRGHQSKASNASSAGRTPQLDQFETLASPVRAPPPQDDPRATLCERPSTSLGHFDEVGTRRRDLFGLGSGSTSPTTNGRVRQAASRYGGLNLDNSSPLASPRRTPGSMILSRSASTAIGTQETPGRNAIDEEEDEDNGPPIARYYAKLRGEAATPDVMHIYRFGQSQSDRTLLRSPSGTAGAGSSIPILASRGSSPHPIWSHRQTNPSLTSSTTNASGASVDGDHAGSSETTPTAHRHYAPSMSGALDRPRPPTSSQVSFFAGRERRKASVAGLEGFVAMGGKHARGSSKGSSGAERSREASHEGSGGGGAASTSTRPLNIAKKSTPSIDEGRGGDVTKQAWMVSSSCSTNTVSTQASSSVATHDTPMTHSLRSLAAVAAFAEEVDAAIDEKRIERDAAAFGKSLERADGREDVRSDIERYLDKGPVSIHDRWRLFEQHAG